MKNRRIYTFIAILILVGIYAYEFHCDKQFEEKLFKEGEFPKKDTNEYFLPSSTTGLIVHHESYSLSYDEDHEQAEWVAYELKKSHLSNTNFYSSR